MRKPYGQEYQENIMARMNFLWSLLSLKFWGNEDFLFVLMLQNKLFCYFTCSVSRNFQVNFGVSRTKIGCGSLRYKMNQLYHSLSSFNDSISVTNNLYLHGTNAQRTTFLLIQSLSDPSAVRVRCNRISIMFEIHLIGFQMPISHSIPFHTFHCICSESPAPSTDDWK